jgi:hypothetical protein
MKSLFKHTIQSNHINNHKHMVLLLYLHKSEAKKTKFDEARQRKTNNLRIVFNCDKNILLYRDDLHMNYYI